MDQAQIRNHSAFLKGYAPEKDNLYAEIVSANELLSAGQTALIIYTEGRGLTDKHDGNASSGWWRINPNRKIDLVVIYRRDCKSPTNNDIFVGKPDGTEGPFNLPGLKTPRYIVLMRDFKFVANTSSNWRDFADAFMAPIRYLTKT